MNIYITVFITSSIEAPKLQRPPETFVPSVEKALLLKEWPKNGYSTLLSHAAIIWVHVLCNPASQALRLLCANIVTPLKTWMPGM
jgi:hypothetical protein